MTAFISSSLLMWLLVGVRSQKGFTASGIKMNMALFHMLYDLLLLSKDIVILTLRNKGYEQFCKISTRPGYVFVLCTVLNNMLLALNHYCLHKSRRRKIYLVFLSRKNTRIAIATTWIISALWAIVIKFLTRKVVTVSDGHYYICRGLLPKTASILFSGFVCTLQLLINLVYYRIYKNAVACLKERSLGSRNEEQGIRLRIRSIRCSFITSLWVSVIFGLAVVAASMIPMIINTNSRGPRIATNASLFILYILPVQLISLIAHVLMNRRSRRQIWNFMQKVNFYRQRRVGIINRDCSVARPTI